MSSPVVTGAQSDPGSFNSNTTIPPIYLRNSLSIKVTSVLVISSKYVSSLYNLFSGNGTVQFHSSPEEFLEGRTSFFLLFVAVRYLRVSTPTI